LYLVFLNIAISDLQALLTAFKPPPELARPKRLASSFFTLIQLTHSKNIVRDGQEPMAIITMIVSSVLACTILIS
jgi:hypothetical protein